VLVFGVRGVNLLRLCITGEYKNSFILLGDSLSCFFLIEIISQLKLSVFWAVMT
jgi:hypothetical protein